MTQITDDIIMAYLLEPIPEPLTPAERSRQWRQRRREEGHPDTKTVDSAIVEATSFLMSLSTKMPVLVNAVDLVRVATVVLIREGFDRKLSRSGILERLRRRPAHDGMAVMPSRQLHSRDQLIAPPRHGEWADKDIQLIREISGQTPAAPPLPHHTS